MQNEISKQDIINVAKSINKSVSESQINWILENYNSHKKQDPKTNWSLIVENMLYELPLMEKQFKTTTQSEIKTWYLTTYSDDKQGVNINWDITFEQAAYCLKSKDDFYEFIGIADTIIRERIFEKIAELYEIDYSVVYNQWLLPEFKVTKKRFLEWYFSIEENRQSFLNSCINDLKKEGTFSTETEHLFYYCESFIPVSIMEGFDDDGNDTSIHVSNVELID